MSAAEVKQPDKKNKKTYFTRKTSVFTHTQNGNAKSAVGDEQRLVRPVDKILAEAAGKEFHHAAFAMCA